MFQSSSLRAGDWVWVRSKEEILATLDKNGRFEEVPFMPEMLQYCGQKMRVFKRAHKLCDTQYSTAGRTMEKAVLLEGARCTGRDFAGCELNCLMFWKESWLKPVDESLKIAAPVQSGAGCTEADLFSATRLVQIGEDAEPRYSCQATQLTPSTKPLKEWSLPHFVEDFTSRNEAVGTILGGLFKMWYRTVAESGLGFGSAMRWTYDKVQAARGRTGYPFRRGLLPMNGPTPTTKLNLQPGDLVRVKSHPDILKTVNIHLGNRGMGFHAELVSHCGKTTRVKTRVTKIVDEKTGRLLELKNPCIVLDGVKCTGRHVRPLFCPKNCDPYFREVWLERLDAPAECSAAVEADCQQTV